MRLKSLIKKFSYNDLLKTCEREGWQIPSSKDVEGKDLEHEEFWVSDLPEKQDRETHAHIYNQRWSQVLQIANKHFLINAVVIVEEKVCEWKGDDEFNTYHTQCEKSFQLMEGTTKDNEMKFCCYCGEKIKEKDEK